MRLTVTIIASLLLASFVVEAAGAADPAPSDSVWADYTDIVKDARWKAIYDTLSANSRASFVPGDPNAAWMMRMLVFASCKDIPGLVRRLPPMGYEEAYYERGASLCLWWMIQRYPVDEVTKKAGFAEAELPETLTAA